MNGTYNSNGAAFTIANYEPRSVIASSVKPVYTPANAPDHYRQLAKKMLASRKTGRGQTQIRRPDMLPGTGFTGPNIYVRALLALQSGEPAEVRYALHHLVKISHERGDKYMFDQFPSLAEALLEQVLKVSTLFHNVKWRVSYDPDESTESDVLDALRGTPYLLKKIRAHTEVAFTDGLQSEDFTTTMSNVNEAALVLRNMVMLEHNAQYISRIPLAKDFVTIVLSLPRRAVVIELQHYALEIAEQITKFFVLGADDPLYQSLLAQLDLSDRGAVITTLRALSRISMNLEAQNRLPNVPISSLLQISDWLLVEDEELRNACLDFLYQFTAVTENVEVLLQHTDTEALVSQLVRILMYGATLEEKRDRSKTMSKLSAPAAAPPKLSDSIVEQLTQITDDRELSQAWSVQHVAIY
jgi:chromatin structure-remodeling complex subunit RSC9